MATLSEPGTITELLRTRNLDALYPRVEKELEKIVHARLRQVKYGKTLRTRAILDDAFLMVVGNKKKKITWEDRAHFYGIAALAIRNILVNYFKKRMAQKRGGDAAVFDLGAIGDIPVDEAAGQVLDLHQALTLLEAENKRQSKVVELRFFGGHSVEETAAILNISKATVKRDWAVAKVKLKKYMAEG